MRGLCRRFRRLGFAACVIGMLDLSDAAAAGAQTCAGDCDDNGAVTVNELIVGVNILLAGASVTQCPSLDADGSGSATVNELITAVNHLLQGCEFHPSQGVVLSGAPDDPAITAITDVPPAPADDDDLQDGVILTRLDVHLTAAATVGQVNAVLESIGAGIVTMRHDQPTLTLGIPRPADVNALAAIVQRLRAMPGISWTAIAHTADAKVLPPHLAGDSQDEIDHLLPARFPAAWNASRLATDGCAARRVKVLVADHFAAFPLISPYDQFIDEIPNLTFVGSSRGSQTHGYDVTTTIAALFDAANPTGANPFSDCLDVELIPLTGSTEYQILLGITSRFPAEKFLINYSIGYPDVLSTALLGACARSGCSVAQIENEIDAPLTRGYDAADWVGLTSSRSDDFLVSVAAGNERSKPATAVYTGLGVAVCDAEMSTATLLPDLTFVDDAGLWGSATIGFPSLVPSSAELTALEHYVQALGVSTSAPTDNVMIVGSTTSGRTVDALVQSSFSDGAALGYPGADAFAVGEHVFSLGGFVRGTSFAAPQLTGLASYLWLLSPELRGFAASATRQAIVENARGIGVIDAYASILSLDAAALPNPTNAPVRLAILDVNDDGVFDESDLDTLLGKVVNGNPAQDYSRFDLNGDGFTGGATTERFDLDRVGSTRFGATRYSTVDQPIEGTVVSFDELQLTDLDIICYYAYSALYTGDTGMRRQLTAGHCGVAVTVDPAAVTLSPEGTQQFSASVRGTADPRVTWVVASGDGSITPTGLFTAGHNAGMSTVRAVSVADPNAFADAAVTVRTGGRYAGTLTFTLHTTGPDVVPTEVALTAMITADVIGNSALVLRSASGSVQTSTADMTCGPTTFVGTIDGFFQPAPDQLPIFPNMERPMSFLLNTTGTQTSFGGSPETGCVQFEEPAGPPFGGFFVVTNVQRNLGEVVEIDFDKTVSAGEVTSVLAGSLVP